MSLQSCLKQRSCSTCHALVFVGTRLNQESDNFKVPFLSCYAQRRCSICLALVFVGTGLNQKPDNFNVPFLSCNKQGSCSICLALVFVGTGLDQEPDDFKVSFQSLPWIEALLHLSCLGLCWHRTPPEIEQLQRALSELLHIKALLHLSFFGLCWHRTLPEIGTASRCSFRTATCRGVSPSSGRPWSLQAPDSTRNRTTSTCPSWAATNKGVSPFVLPWSLLAPDSTRNRTTSRCPFHAATHSHRGVSPSSVMPWSLLAPDSTRNRTTWMCPSSDATNKGVAPSSGRRWSLFAPDSTRNRTTSMCPSPAAACKGVSIVSPLWVRPWSICAPASISKCTHFKLPWQLATYKKGVLPSASSKFGFRGWLSCSSRSLSSFSWHAIMTSRSCSKSRGKNSRITSCTTFRLMVSLSSIGRLSSKSRRRNRVRPIFCARRPFQYPNGNHPHLPHLREQQIGSPVSAECTSSIGREDGSEGYSNQKSPNVACRVCWNILNQIWLKPKWPRTNVSYKRAFSTFPTQTQNPTTTPPISKWAALTGSSTGSL